MINKAIFFSIFLTLSCSLKPASDQELTNKPKAEQPACICYEIYEPVCSVKENKTYSNSCVAKCNGVKRFKKGACSL